MLLVLMYHQILTPGHKQAEDLFKQHLNYLQNNFPIVVPGQALTKNTLNICLTFDDAYCDFYYYIYPLIKQLKIPVVLGVPTKFIQETTTVAKQDRLNVDYPFGLADNMQHLTPLCTWEEILEMTTSGYVHAASHGHAHLDLTTTKLDVQQELQTSKTILEEKLKSPISTIIYPFGRTSRSTNQIALENFNYAMRISGAVNMDWQSRGGLIYRVNADLFWQKNKYISNSFLLKAKLKYWLNYIRHK